MKLLNKWLVLAVFYTFILLPLVFTTANNVSNENRVLAPRPSLNLDGKLNLQFPSQFDSWINDHLGFRDFFLKSNALIHNNILRTSMVDTVVVGKDGWLFYNDSIETIRPISMFQNATPYSTTELDNLALSVKRNLDILEQNGIKTLVTVAPNKETVYGEMYASGVNKVSQQSRLQQFEEKMQLLGVDILDLTDPLLQAKKTESMDLYLKADSHWNQQGAFIGYTEIMDRISINFPNLPALTLDDFVITESQTGIGNLNSMVGSVFPKSECINYTFTPKEPRPFTVVRDEMDENTVHRLITRIEDESLPTAIMFHDSFTHGSLAFDSYFTGSLAVLLSNHFSNIEYIWGNASINNYLPYVLLQNPDIVIFESLELYLSFWNKIGDTEVHPFNSEQLKIDFITGGNSNQYTLNGFYEMEPGGTWSKENTANLYIPSQTKDSFLMNITGTFLAPGMSATVFVNEQLVGTITEGGTTNFLVPESSLNGEFISVKFEFPIVKTPLEVLGVEGDRMLCYIFQEINLSSKN